MPSLPAKPPASNAQADDTTISHSTFLKAVDKSTSDSADDTNSSTGEVREEENLEQSERPPLPSEEPPPLPNEPVPINTEDDGWEPVWDDNAQAFYFYNRLTQATQWENPRVPQETTTTSAAIADNGPPGANSQPIIKKSVAGGYDPAIHGDYDPDADYAKAYASHDQDQQLQSASTADPTLAYAATGTFNRFTGKWQSADVNPERFNDENKSKRQMNAFFDVDAAANAHDGRSLKAERSSKKITKQELKAYREKRKEKKEEKRRAWLRD